MKRAPRLSPNEAAEHLIATLAAFEPMSSRQYAEIAGLSPQGAADRMERARAAGLVHVAHYARGRSAPPAAFYAIGGVPSALPLRALTDSEKQTAYRKRVMADPVKAAKWRKKKLARDKRARKANTVAVQKARAAAAARARAKKGSAVRMPSIRRDPLLAILSGVRR